MKIERVLVTVLALQLALLAAAGPAGAEARDETVRYTKYKKFFRSPHLL